MPMIKDTMLKRLLLPKLAAGGGGSAPVQETATGNPLTFLTDLAKPLKSLLIPFSPVQSGTGDPSPDNIRPILPWDGLTVWQNGADVPITWDVESDGKYIGADGSIGQSSSFHYSDLLPVTQGEYRYTFTASGFATNRNTRIHGYNSSGEWVEQLAYESTQNGTYNIDFTVPVGISYIRISNAKNVTNESVINVTETDISFASPVYGGKLDVVSGVLTVEYVTVDLGSLSWNYNSDRFYTTGLANVIKRGASARRLVMYCSIFLCISDGRSQANVPDMSMYEGGNGNVFIHDSDYTDKDTFKEAMDGIALCYPLATPQTVQLTAEQITALIGDNTIWSDADGSMTAVYLKKAQ